MARFKQLILVLMALLAASELAVNAEPRRRHKILSLFNIIEFPNAVCAGSNGRNGTCYTTDECSSLGGVSAGNCAQGFGTCCTFTVSCGSRSTQNCTYFESSGLESGTCAAQICPKSINICQLRLDFETFAINGPSSETSSILKTINGQASETGKAVTRATQCLIDSFTVTSTGAGRASSTLCGTNTGEHLYVTANQNCNDLIFQLGMAANTNRAWRIKVTQYSCDFSNLAPTGCDQFFFGTSTNTVRSFNYNNGVGYHLASQDQNICVRQERGLCRICWTAMNDADVMISGSIANKGFADDQCCGYGNDGMGTNGFDCLRIPLASKEPRNANNKFDLLANNAFCGRSKGLVSTPNGAAITICSRSIPFQLRFISDQYEFAAEAALAKARGFQLTYTLSGGADCA